MKIGFYYTYILVSRGITKQIYNFQSVSLNVEPGIMHDIAAFCFIEIRSIENYYTFTVKELQAALV